MFTPHHGSFVMCHMSPVTCYLSRVTSDVLPVTCHLFFYFFIFFFFFLLTKQKKQSSQLVESLLSTGLTPSSKKINKSGKLIFSHTQKISLKVRQNQILLFIEEFLYLVLNPKIKQPSFKLYCLPFTNSCFISFKEQRASKSKS